MMTSERGTAPLLRRKSQSLPKLSTASSFEDGENFDVNMRLTTDKPWVKADVIQLCSGRSLAEVGKNRSEDSSSNLWKSSSSLQKEKNDFDLKSSDNKMKLNTRGKLSARLRGIFQSLFNLDRKATYNLYGSQFGSNFGVNNGTLNNGRSKSLPDLQRKIQPQNQPVSKSISFRNHRASLSNLLRKSRRKLNSNRSEKNQSFTSLNKTSSCESSPDFSTDRKRNVVARRRKSTGCHSGPNSPLCHESENHRFFKDNTPESSPQNRKDKIAKLNCLLPKENEEGKEVHQKSEIFKTRRQRYRRSKTTEVIFTGFSRAEKYATSRSFSESSDAEERYAAEELSQVIISHACAAAQRRRKTLTRGQSFGKIERVEEEKGFQGDNKQNKRGEESHDGSPQTGGTKSPQIGGTKELQQLVEKQLEEFLKEKIFHSENSKRWCKEMSETIKDQLHIMTRGLYKIVVQVYIGAVEEDGITTATQCNFNPENDDFTVVSFCNKSLFAIASVLVMDFRDLANMFSKRG